MNHIIKSVISKILNYFKCNKAQLVKDAFYKLVGP